MEAMNPTTLEIVATALFGLAVVHTFTVKQFDRLAHHYPEGTARENLFHFLGEVEVVFGLWAAVLVLAITVVASGHEAVEYMESVNFTEPVFVFTIMAMAATRPIINLATSWIQAISHLLPLPTNVSFFLVALIVGPLLGSFMTEPAAMTVTALILRDRYYSQSLSKRLMYATIGVLFVNVSIGGTLTHFAAPPVLMVARTWDWDMMHMLTHFGWKAAIAVVINAVVLTAVFRKELANMTAQEQQVDVGDEWTHSISHRWEGGVRPPVPLWLTGIHLLFMSLVVLNAHHMVIFVGLFLFFMGIAQVTHEHQDRLQLREALLVGFFLAGLVTLGGYQKWWLQPLIGNLGSFTLFLGATGLTAITDNAALTYLGSLVEGLPAVDKYALVAGAVTGGGLTVIANAPNPAGFGILKSSFGEDGISPLGLLVAGLIPTTVAAICFWGLRSIPPIVD